MLKISYEQNDIVKYLMQKKDIYKLDDTQVVHYDNKTLAYLDNINYYQYRDIRKVIMTSSLLGWIFGYGEIHLELITGKTIKFEYVKDYKAFAENLIAKIDDDNNNRVRRIDYGNHSS